MVQGYRSKELVAGNLDGNLAPFWFWSIRAYKGEPEKAASQVKSCTFWADPYITWETLLGLHRAAAFPR